MGIEKMEEAGKLLGKSIIFFFLLFASQVYAQENSCIGCHFNKQKMSELGYSQFYFTAEEIVNQTRMPAQCADCHLGNASTPDKEGGHKGLLKLLVIGNKELKPVANRTNVLASLTPSGTSRIDSLLPKDPKAGVNTLRYHDIEPALLSFDSKLAEKTCGKCHSKQVNEYRHTAMGMVRYQSSYELWNDENGPHNCGPWFIDSVNEKDNWVEIAKELNVNYTRKQAEVNQRACNNCHAGCLDCHSTAYEGKGVHKFESKTTSISCYGGGRGSFCHTGPEERRRGAGYLGAEFSAPKGREPDVHVKYNLTCTDCHDSKGKGGHAGMVRSVTAACSKCHEKAVSAAATSVHKNLACEACHIRDVGGYQGTYWGPGKVGGVETPFKKYNDIYGNIINPILIKDAKGIWIPTKPYPMAVVNIKEKAAPSNGVKFRRSESRDAYAMMGTFEGLPKNDKALLWLQMDKTSHALRKSRECESCHATTEQKFVSKWNYSDQGAKPFSGEHAVIANSSGIYVVGLVNTTPIITEKGWEIADLAPWYYLKDKFSAKGDYSLPKADTKAYEREKTEFSKFAEAIKALEVKLQEAEARGVDAAVEKKLLKEATSAGVHNSAEGNKLLGEASKKIEEKTKKGICGPTATALLATLPLLLLRFFRKSGC